MLEADSLGCEVKVALANGYIDRRAVSVDRREDEYVRVSVPLINHEYGAEV